MTTLQEQFEKNFSDKSVEKIDARAKYYNSNFTNRDLDLREYTNLTSLNLKNNNLTSVDLSQQKNLTSLNLSINNLTNIDLSQQKNLTELRISNNNLTSVDFLNTLPNSERLEALIIYNNKIQPTDIEIFSKFVNLKTLKIGTENKDLKQGKHNKFYGSLKAYQNLTKLGDICIEATDVNEGLEYLPENLVKRIKEGSYTLIECSPHNTNAKCKAIQDQLRPFNYDLEAWQLAHPEKMLIARPELFTQEESKEKWIKVLVDKITNSQKELQEVKDQEADKTKKITRLESKISELERAKSTISQQTQTEFSTQDKSTQTDLTMEKIKQWEQEDSKKTLYQKFVEKYDKK